MIFSDGQRKLRICCWIDLADRHTSELDIATHVKWQRCIRSLSGPQKMCSSTVKSAREFARRGTGIVGMNMAHTGRIIDLHNNSAHVETHTDERITNCWPEIDSKSEFCDKGSCSGVHSQDRCPKPRRCKGFELRSHLFSMCNHQRNICPVCRGAHSIGLCHLTLVGLNIKKRAGTEKWTYDSFWDLWEDEGLTYQRGHHVYAPMLKENDMDVAVESENITNSTFASQDGLF